jgi:hypothetical protein
MFLLCITSTAMGKIIYVDDNAPSANDGSSWENAYNFLQDALADADSSPKPVEIRVAQGIYRPGVATLHPNGTGSRYATFQLINDVTLKGGHAGFGEPDPNVWDVVGFETILDGENGSYHVVTGIDTDETAILDGFTITGGNANVYGYSRDVGGGVFCDSATLRNCSIRHNSALSDGGGMYNWDRSILINCTFIENWAGFSGGGMMNYGGPILINCTFNGNSAGDYGGGMQSFDTFGDAKLINCIFEGNTAQNGGGMCEYEAASKLINCIFRRNSADKQGGGMFNRYWGDSMLINCTFSGNSAYESGGGVSNKMSGPSFTNCVFSGNSTMNEGGGIYHKARDSWDNLTIKNCTFAGNSAEKGNTLYCTFMYPHEPITVQFANCILWDGGNEIWNGEASKITIAYTDIWGGQTTIYDPCDVVIWAVGNIDADPQFINPVSGDYHLLPGSPCIDAGDPNYPYDPNEIDLDGKPRIIGERIDMGAYEYLPPISAAIKIVPRTINLHSKGKWITCYIGLPEEYNVTDINPNSIFLEDEIQPDQFSVDEQEQIAIARFSRKEVQAILSIGEVELTITGRLTDGTAFEAIDIIKVVDKGGGKSPQ